MFPVYRVTHVPGCSRHKTTWRPSTISTLLVQLLPHVSRMSGRRIRARLENHGSCRAAPSACWAAWSRCSSVGVDHVGANGFGLTLQRQRHGLSLRTVACCSCVDLVRNNDLTGQGAALQTRRGIHHIADGRKILCLALAHVAHRSHADMDAHADREHILRLLTIDLTEECLGCRYHHFGRALPKRREVGKIKGHHLVANEFDQGIVTGQHATCQCVETRETVRDLGRRSLLRPCRESSDVSEQYPHFPLVCSDRCGLQAISTEIWILPRRGDSQQLPNAAERHQAQPAARIRGKPPI